MGICFFSGLVGDTTQYRDIVNDYGACEMFRRRFFLGGVFGHLCPGVNNVQNICDTKA